MKLKLLFAAVLIFTLTQLQAQRLRTEYNYSFNFDQTAMVFPKGNLVSYYPHQVRIVARNKTVIDVQMQQIRQLQVLKNIDSILALAWADVQPLKDSFPNDLNNRLLDINYAPDGHTKMRIKTYPPRGSSFVKTTEGLALLKIEQDTLFIMGNSGPGHLQTIVVNPGIDRPSWSKRDSFYAYTPWTISIRINNLSEIPSLIGTLNQHMNTIAADYAAFYNYKKPDDNMNKVNLVYEPFSAYTGKDKYIVYKKRPKNKLYYATLVQAGIQNVRSSFSASAGLGVGFSSIIMDNPGNSYHLVWEPFFFFDKNGSGKTVIQRNDFITFQYRKQWGEFKKGTDINISNSFSLGYLVHRDGDYFNKHTFKMGLPGMQLRNLLLQPQFIFNDLFKQFYPSLKLQVQVD